MAGAGWLLATLSSLTLLLASLPATGLPLETPDLQEAPTYDEGWAESFQDAMAWSKENSHLTANGLILAAGTQGWTDDALDQYEETSQWAETTLNQRVTTNGLEERLTTLLASLGAPDVGWSVQLDQVPSALYPALNVLLQAQDAVATNSQAYPSINTDPLGHTRAMLFDGLHLAAAVDVVVPHLAGLPDEAWPEEPAYIDPFGIIIVGATTDDTYEQRNVAGFEYRGPTLLIEPGGNDTYNHNVATGTGLWFDGEPRAFLVAVPPIAIELHGNDTYHERVAANGAIGATALLYERNGNDTYGTLDNHLNTAVGNHGASVLHDKNGDDTYQTKDFGLAYANKGLAVLTDRAGNDRYEAEYEKSSALGFTHAAGEDFGAIAVLRDYGGDDEYFEQGVGLGYAKNDANAIFIDDEGADAYHAGFRGRVDFGAKSLEGANILTAPLGRSLGYFLDGHGTDSYTWDDSCCNPRPVGNELNRTDTRWNHKYSVFIDCTTPPGASYPCPEGNDDTLGTIGRAETSPLLPVDS